jgi:hypothetical protein
MKSEFDMMYEQVMNEIMGAGWNASDLARQIVAEMLADKAAMDKIDDYIEDMVFWDLPGKTPGEIAEMKVKVKEEAVKMMDSKPAEIKEDTAGTAEKKPEAKPIVMASVVMRILLDGVKLKDMTLSPEELQRKVREIDATLVKLSKDPEHTMYELRPGVTMENRAVAGKLQAELESVKQ